MCIRDSVLTLGQEIEVVVEEIDEKGKVSLTPSDSWNPQVAGGSDAPVEGSRTRSAAPAAAPTVAIEGAVTVSFDDAFDAELAGELGDLGPGGEAGGNERGDRAPRDAGGRDGGRGGRDGRRRHR